MMDEDFEAFGGRVQDFGKFEYIHLSLTVGRRTADKPE